MSKKQKVNIEQIREEAISSVKEEQPWLLTYADMMTLLFALFVLLFSMSTLDPVKVSNLISGVKTNQEIVESLEKIIEKNNLDNAESPEESKAKIVQDPRGVAIAFDGDMCFGQLSAEMNNELMNILNDIDRELLNIEGDIRGIIIEGHTDSDPIPLNKMDKYPTNWELSSARASSVVNYLIKKLGVNPGRLQAVGYAEQWPHTVSWSDYRQGKADVVAANQTEEDKVKNRRIKLIFQTKSELVVKTENQ